MKYYHSQHDQDKWLNDNVFKNKKNGFFVEAGAGDGKALSNTFFFEKKLGWTGLLIEPNAEKFSQIGNHRNCNSTNKLLWSDSQKLNFISNDQFNGAIKSQECKSPAVAAEFGSPQCFKNETIKGDFLHDILKKESCPSKIDLLSLDIEGAERQVIASFDFNLFYFTAILLEVQFTKFNFESFLNQKGYKKIHTIKDDHIYINKNEYHLYK